LDSVMGIRVLKKKKEILSDTKREAIREENR